MGLSKIAAVAFLRFIQVLCLILVASFVAIPKFQCDWGKTPRTNGTSNSYFCEAAESPISIKHWSDGGEYKVLEGQFFVFVTALVFAAISLALIFASCCNCEVTKLIMIFLLGFGAFVLFVAGCVEAWYASGFGKMPQIDMWIAASALCFFGALLYVIDISVITKSSSDA